MFIGLVTSVTFIWLDLDRLQMYYDWNCEAGHYWKYIKHSLKIFLKAWLGSLIVWKIDFSPVVSERIVANEWFVSLLSFPRYHQVGGRNHSTVIFILCLLISFLYELYYCYVSLYIIWQYCCSLIWNIFVCSRHKIIVPNELSMLMVWLLQSRNIRLSRRVSRQCSPHILHILVYCIYYICWQMHVFEFEFFHLERASITLSFKN